MAQIGSYNSPIKSKGGELIIKGKVQSNEEFKAPLVISHEFETSALTGTISATVSQILGIGTAFKSELSINDYIVVNGIAYRVASIPSNNMMFVDTGAGTGFSNVEFSKLTNPLENGSLLELKYGESSVLPLFKISLNGDVVLSGNVDSDRLTSRLVQSDFVFGEHSGTLASTMEGHTQDVGDSSLAIATTEYVRSEIISLLQENGLID